MSTDLEVRDDGGMNVTLFGTDNPAEALAQMTKVAGTLAQVVRDQNLIVRIGQSEHVRVEGWTFLGSLLGVFPIVTWTRPVLDENGETIGWEARVEARTRAGELVGAAEAQCLRSERSWAKRDDYALRSMAQTRAVSKALRLPLGFVMQLAGFNPTPAEEMTIEGSSGEPRTAAAVSSPGGFGESAMVASPDAQDPAHGTPFQYDIDAPVEPAGSMPHDADWWGAPLEKNEPMWRYLNVLVGKLRPDHVSTLQLWEGMNRAPVPSEDGLLHWSPLRDSLSRHEASGLISRLETLGVKKSVIHKKEQRRDG